MFEIVKRNPSIIDSKIIFSKNQLLKNLLSDLTIDQNSSEKEFKFFMNGNEKFLKIVYEIRV